MNVKKVLINGYALGALGTYGLLARSDAPESPILIADPERICYATLLQAGANHIEFVADRHPLRDSSKFLAARSSLIRPAKLRGISQDVERSIQKPFYQDGFAIFPKGLLEVIMFLDSIALAVERGADAFYPFPMPNADVIKDTWPPAIGIPLYNFLSSVQQQEIVSLVPQLSLNQKDFRLFKQILSEDLFTDYTHAHIQLNSDRISIKDAANAIEKTSERVVSKYRGVLDLKSSLIGLIPVTPKIVEVICGKLPGTLSQFFADRFSSWLSKEKRMVIYQADELLRKLATKNKKASPDLSN